MTTQPSPDAPGIPAKGKPDVPIDDQLRTLLRPHIEQMRATHVAKLAGVHRSDISHWLSGRRGMPMAKIDAIAAACRLQIRISVRARRVALKRKPPEA